jgi:hypothetical protein
VDVRGKRPEINFVLGNETGMKSGNKLFVCGSNSKCFLGSGKSENKFFRRPLLKTNY